jgi:hypothetical protein
MSVIRWVTKISYLELLRASEGTLSCWSRLHCHLLDRDRKHNAIARGGILEAIGITDKMQWSAGRLRNAEARDSMLTHPFTECGSFYYFDFAFLAKYTLESLLSLPWSYPSRA